MLGVPNKTAEKSRCHMWCGEMYVVVSGILQEGKGKFSAEQCL